MDHAKNFKIRDVIFRTAAYVIYFFAAGFIGKLCAELSEPLFSLALKRRPDIQNIALYIISVAAAVAALSYFSRRDGCNDTELLRFNRRRAVWSYVISGIIFGALSLVVSDCFFTQRNIPGEIHAIAASYVFMPGFPVLSGAAEYIKYILASDRTGLYLYILTCVLFCSGFYKSGQSKRTAEKKSKIKKYK